MRECECVFANEVKKSDSQQIKWTKQIASPAGGLARTNSEGRLRQNEVEGCVGIMLAAKKTMEHRSPTSGLPPAVLTLVDKLSGFPGVGRKSALRMALHILRSSCDTAQEMADALLAVKNRIIVCSTCGTLAEQDPCPICADTRRDHSLICVVEEPGDAIALERTGGWSGVYHVLGGAISPLDGIGPDQLRMDSLAARVKAGGVKEVVVATNPNAEGETTALYIARMLRETGVLVTRIARGVPVGSDLELTDDSTLTAALRGRGEMGLGVGLDK